MERWQASEKPWVSGWMVDRLMRCRVPEIRHGAPMLGYFFTVGAPHKKSVKKCANEPAKMRQLSWKKAGRWYMIGSSTIFLGTLWGQSWDKRGHFFRPLLRTEDARCSSKPLKTQCRREDLNLHGGIPHMTLNHARLPIPPLRQFPTLQYATLSYSTRQ